MLLGLLSLFIFFFFFSFSSSPFELRHNKKLLEVFKFWNNQTRIRITFESPDCFPFPPFSEPLCLLLKKFFFVLGLFTPLWILIAVSTASLLSPSISLSLDFFRHSLLYPH